MAVPVETGKPGYIVFELVDCFIGYFIHYSLRKINEGICDQCGQDRGITNPA